MQNPAERIQNNFLECIKKQKFPVARTHFVEANSTLSTTEWVDLFESQVIARQLDIIARELRAKNQSFYTIGSSGHEGNAAVAKASRLSDMAFLHYRSAAFMVQRAKSLAGSTPGWDNLLAFVASSDCPTASGRHKVFGSLALNVPPQTSTIASHVPKAVGAALSIPLAESNQLQTKLPNDGVVLCSFGDASLNHSTTQGALQTAQWLAYQGVGLPLVFVCEDNGLGISVATPQDWVQNSIQSRPMLEYFTCDGLNILETYEVAKKAIGYARAWQKPVFLHVKTVRLMGHAGSDVETEYLSTEEIASREFNDPLLHTARMIFEAGRLSLQEMIGFYQHTGERLRRVADVAVNRPKLTTPADVMTDIVPKARCVNDNEINWPNALQPFGRYPALNSHRKTIAKAEREKVFANEAKWFKRKHHMAKLINWALMDALLQYDNAVIFGEDVAQKGGVYHVTAGLWKRFGATRVFNSVLDEQSIIGTGIGLAHNGFLPIPEIQFLAYLHNAEDQVRGEAATLPFFSSGQFTNPMVLRIAGLAYQKGFGGHFHNDNSLAVLRDIPGLIIGCPSNGADAVKMLRTCLHEANEHGRVCAFIEPIALYMTKDLIEPRDGLWTHLYPEAGELVPLGQANVIGEGKDCLVISYGNGHYLSSQAAHTLTQSHNINITQIDLRWIAPLDKKTLVETASQFDNVLVVEECRETGSVSEAIVTLLAEECEHPPKIKRVAAKDSFIPLADAANLVLPAADDIVEAVKTMCQVKQNLKAAS